ncbi:siderophore-interacting protein [Kineococcus mangrovi]|uniref:siderophore-interacting protein n=1 Tax=Kineococcus mangrovi TaxID=1660183 RepID=UPI003521089C
MPTKVGYPVGLRRLVVLRREQLNRSLLRVVLGGADLAGFCSRVPEEHVRLLFPDPDGSLRLPVPEGPDLRWPRPLPTSREYTVRHHDPDAGELWIDLAVHPGGLASDWAVAAAPGTRVHVAGPPGGMVLPGGFDRFLFAGDLTAQPQIARYLERLPSTATGWAVLDVVDAGEELPMTAPAGVQVSWVHRGDVPVHPGGAFERVLRSLPLDGGARTFLWIAGEAGVLKPLRRWVRHDLGLPRSDHLVTGYWKRGVADYDED